MNIEQVLSSAATDEKVVRDEALEKVTSQLNYSLPIIKKIDLRLGVNGNNTRDTLDGNLRNEDYYSFNLSTNKLKEMKLQRAMKPLQTNLFTKEKELYYMQALQERYTAITGLYYSTELYKKKKELQNLLLQKNEMLQQLLSDGVNFKISDAMDTEKDLIMLLGLIQEEENNITLNQARIRQYMGGNSEVNVDFTGIISIQKIIAMDSTLSNEKSSIHPSIVYKEAQYQYAQANHKLERSQNMNVFNSFQVGYNRPAYSQAILTKFKPENTLTFRFGVSIPVSGNYNFNRNNALLQEANALQSWHSSEITQGKIISIQQSRLDNSILQYNALLDIYEKSVVTRLLSNEKVLAQSTALEIMDMRIARKKFEINLLSNAGNVAQNYIQLLENKGLLKYEFRHQYLLEN